MGSSKSTFLIFISTFSINLSANIDIQKIDPGVSSTTTNNTYKSQTDKNLLSLTNSEIKYVFSLKDDNDFWGRWSDKYYTNHTRFGWTIDLQEESQRYYFFSFGQEFYTPANKTAIVPSANDHPYAGFLYGSAGIATHKDNLLLSLELQAGILGPSGIGYEIQKSWHKMINDPVPNGWDSQIKDQLGINALAEVRHHIEISSSKNTTNTFETDLLIRGFCSLGTVRTIASGGAQFRFGINLPNNFGYTPMRQSTSVVLPTNGETSFYGFIDLQGDAIAYDATLGGELLKNHYSDIYVYPFAAQATIGIGINYGRWELCAFQSFRTQDFSSADKSFFAFGGFQLSTTF